MRLIDADALLKKIWEQRHEHPNAYHLSNYAELLACEAPTVDAVEVVRCRDCTHITPVEGGVPLCTMHDRACGDYDFCSYGERRSE